MNNDEEVAIVVKSCLGTKMLSKWMDLAVKVALDAVKTIKRDIGNHMEIDIKRYCRIEKVIGCYSILIFNPCSFFLFTDNFDCRFQVDVLKIVVCCEVLY